MEYINAQEASKKWGISNQTIMKYCKEGLIENATKEGKQWKIPADAVIHTSRNKLDHTEFKFIDLFCGIGGFHQAMKKLGGKCVFACDISTQCREIYKKNFCPNGEFPVEGDIKESIKNKSIPKFDVLCGGFPCQTFSKAGLQNGFTVTENKNGEKDERGQLFYRIIDILREHPECKYIILENVRNLADKKENWSVICDELKSLDFIITEDPLIASPNEFGIPQVRERVFILGIRKYAFDHRRKLPKGYLTEELLHIQSYKMQLTNTDNCLNEILDKNVDEKYLLSKDVADVLEIWDEFRENVKGLMSPFWIHKAGIGIVSKSSP